MRVSMTPGAQRGLHEPPGEGRRQVGGWFPARRLKRVKGCPERSRRRAARAGGGEPCARGRAERAAWCRGAQSGPARTRAAWSALRSIRSRQGSALCARGRAGRVGRPAWVSRAGERRGRGWRPAAGALTLLGLLLPRQRAAQLAEERFVLLHPVGPQGGRAQRRGRTWGRTGTWWPGQGAARLGAALVPPHLPPARPGSGREGAAPAPAPPPPAPGPGGVRRPRSGSGSPRPACESHRRFPRAASLTLQAQRWFPLNATDRTDRVPLCAPFCSTRLSPELW